MLKSDIAYKAREIASRLGKCGCCDIGDYYSVDNRYDCVFNGYGFRICSFYSSKYIESDEEVRRRVGRDGQRDSGTSIEFAGENVFDTNGLYKPGRWEEVFEVLYDKLPIIMEEAEKLKREEEKVCKMLGGCSSVSQRMVEYLRKRDIVWKAGSGTEGDVYTYDYCHYTWHKVLKNGTLVLDMKYYGKEYDSRNCTTFLKYKMECFRPGRWQDEIEEAFAYVHRERERERAMKPILEAQKYLDILKRK